MAQYLITRAKMKTPFGFAITAATAQWVESIWNWWVENWAIRSSACSLAQTAHSFAWSTLLTSTALIRSLACFRAHAKVFFCLWIERVYFISFLHTDFESQCTAISWLPRFKICRHLLINIGVQNMLAPFVRIFQGFGWKQVIFAIFDRWGSKHASIA